MDDRDARLEHQDDTYATGETTAENRQEWVEPKLTFVEPVLTPHGPLTSVTGTIFGPFSPPAD